MPPIKPVRERAPLFHAMGFEWKGESFSTTSDWDGELVSSGSSDPQQVASTMRSWAVVPGGQAWKVESLGLRLALSVQEAYQDLMVGGRIRFSIAQKSYAALPMWAFLDERYAGGDCPLEIDPLKQLTVLAEIEAADTEKGWQLKESLTRKGIARSVSMKVPIPQRMDMETQFTLGDDAVAGMREIIERKGLVTMMVYLLGERIREVV